MNKYLLLFLASSLISFGQVVDTPLFSQTSGFYTNDFDLKLIHVNTDAQIIYTIDGSEPSLDNLSGKTYQYKKQYPEFAGQLPSDFSFFDNQIITYNYTDLIFIYDRSTEPNKIANISTTYKYDQYFPNNSVSKSFVVRAKACINSTCSETNTQIYFIGNKEYSLPIVNISVDEDKLFGYENGLFVAGKLFDEWRIENPSNISDFWTPANYLASGSSSEIEVNFIYFERNRLIINQNAGLRINGSSTRSMANRSHRLYAKKDYGASEFKHTFFKDHNLNHFKRLILRNSGQDSYSTMFKDAFVQTLNKPLKINI